MLNCIALHFSLTISFIVFQKSHLSWNGGTSRKFNVSFNPAKFAPPSKVHAGHHRPGYICPKSNCRIGSSSLRGRSSNLIDSGKDLFRNGLSTSPNFIFWKSLGVIQQLRGQNFAIFDPPPLAWTVFIPWPPVDLYLISEKSIWKNQVHRTRFLVYFERDFYCLCSLQKSISKSCRSLVKLLNGPLFKSWLSSHWITMMNE